MVGIRSNLEILNGIRFHPDLSAVCAHYPLVDFYHCLQVAMTKMKKRKEI